MNRRQRAARAGHRKAELSNAYAERQVRLAREALIKANLRGLTPEEKLLSRAWSGVKSSVQLVSETGTPGAGKKPTDFFRPHLSKGEKPVYQGVYGPVHKPR